MTTMRAQRAREQRVEIAGLAWWTWLTAMLLTAAGVAFFWLNRSNPDQGAGFIAGQVVFAVACATVGGLVTTRRPEHPLGWLFSAGAVLTGAGIVASGWASYALGTSPGSLPGGKAAVFGALLVLPSLVLPVLFGTLLFPAGRLPSRRWRPVAWAAAAGLVLALAATALMPGPIEPYGVPDNPLGIEAAKSVLEPLRAVAFMLLTATGAAALGSLVVRLRRASGVERQQLKWFSFAAALAAVALTLAEALSYDFLIAVQLVAVPLLPAAVGVGILRYRLWDIDVILRRSLVYAALTACVVGTYVAIVSLLGAVLRRDSDLLASLLATGFVAVLFHPLRDRLQRGVNRVLYGERDDPYAVISRVGQRLEDTLAPEAVLPAVAETVAHALRLSSVSVELRRNGRLEPVAMQLDAARDRVASDPSAAQALLAKVGEQARAAVADIRSLAYDLRPPALDELGLVRALEQRATAVSDRKGVAVTVSVVGERRELGAAVEVAAFRIAAEAVANVVRHAQARTCAVLLSFGSSLELEVTDDGRGLGSGFRAGVGISSMRERAAELGGSFSIEAVEDGGTRVLASLPVGKR